MDAAPAGRTQPPPLPGAFDEGLFRACPVVGILRGFEPEAIRRSIEAARRGGLRTVEITMDTPDAAECMARAVADHGAGMNVGAGTVITLERLEAARAAGASFVVTPAWLRSVTDRAAALGLAVFPGALSPTEIWGAWEAGATRVKVFPAEGLGIGYVRALRDDLPGVGLLPTGGVELGSVRAFLEAGAAGFGVGSPLFRRERVLAGDWGWIEAQARAWTETVREWMSR